MYPYDNNDDIFDFFDDSPNNRSFQGGRPPSSSPGGFPQQPSFGGGQGGFSPMPPFGGGQGGFSPMPPFGGGQGGFSPMPPFGGGQGGFSPPPPFGGRPQTPGGQLTPPTAPPPSFTPQITTFQGTAEFSRRGGGRGIGRCLFRNTFIWLTNGNSFWFYPMFAFGNSIIGFRWRGRQGWVYDVLNRNRIAFFQCY